MTAKTLSTMMLECFGTAVITLCYCNSSQSGDWLGYLAGMFVLTSVLVGTTGAHLNPAMTISFMIKRRQSVSSRWLGLGYIIY